MNAPFSVPNFIWAYLTNFYTVLLHLFLLGTVETVYLLLISGSGETIHFRGHTIVHKVIGKLLKKHCLQEGVIFAGSR